MMNEEQERDVLKLLRRIAEALETIALKVDPEFQPKSIEFLLKKNQPRA